jgi:anti-sigma factor RsiW
MNDILCGYRGDRESALMAYLYDESTPDERAQFEGHLATCARCRTELAAFGSVRQKLAAWAPPAFAPLAREAFGQAPPTKIDARLDASRSILSIPAWAQVAAAMLFVGVAAGIANLDVHYDSRNGLNVRTGWSKAPAAPSTANAAAAPATTSPWRADLAALERQLRADMRAAQQTAAVPAASRAASSNDAEVLRQVRALLEQSERRQQSELALRVAALASEITQQRQADLRRIDMSLGRFQDATGVEVLRNRQKLDYLLQRASQQQ